MKSTIFLQQSVNEIQCSKTNVQSINKKKNGLFEYYANLKH